jgi:hypothetical protein
MMAAAMLSRESRQWGDRDDDDATAITTKSATQQQEDRGSKYIELLQNEI